MTSEGPRGEPGDPRDAWATKVDIADAISHAAELFSDQGIEVPNARSVAQSTFPGVIESLESFSENVRKEHRKLRAGSGTGHSLIKYSPWFQARAIVFAVDRLLLRKGRVEGGSMTFLKLREKLSAAEQKEGDALLERWAKEAFKFLQLPESAYEEALNEIVAFYKQKKG